MVSPRRVFRFGIGLLLVARISLTTFADGSNTKFILQAAGYADRTAESHLHAPPTPIASYTTNEVELLAYGALRFYQIVISTQDRPSCMFTPSCSNYAREAIELHGFLAGILMASDRLQRCNGWGREIYPLDPHTGKLIDPP